MRVNLITRPSHHAAVGAGSIPLSLTIRPSCGLPGDYECPTDSGALVQMLRKHTDLPASVIQDFQLSLHSPVGARLLGVDLSDDALTKIGYFID
jgi:hypothetical protein